MKKFDRMLQAARIKQANRYLPSDCRLLDVGCHDGEIFRALESKIVSGAGIDPEAAPGTRVGNGVLEKGYFPADLRVDGPFDAITMLAVVEHVPEETLIEWAKASHDLLRPGGKLIITVPSPQVDHILEVLMKLRVIDGMATEEHHEFDPKGLPALFVQSGLKLHAAKRFQLGLNNLFVFERAL